MKRIMILGFFVIYGVGIFVNWRAITNLSKIELVVVGMPVILLTGYALRDIPLELGRYLIGWPAPLWMQWPFFGYPCMVPGDIPWIDPRHKDSIAGTAIFSWVEHPGLTLLSMKMVVGIMISAAIACLVPPEFSLTVVVVGVLIWTYLINLPRVNAVYTVKTNGEIRVFRRSLFNLIPDDEWVVQLKKLDGVTFNNSLFGRVLGFGQEITQIQNAKDVNIRLQGFPFMDLIKPVVSFLRTERGQKSNILAYAYGFHRLSEYDWYRVFATRIKRIRKAAGFGIDEADDPSLSEYWPRTWNAGYTTGTHVPEKEVDLETHAHRAYELEVWVWKTWCVFLEAFEKLPNSITRKEIAWKVAVSWLESLNPPVPPHIIVAVETGAVSPLAELWEIETQASLESIIAYLGSFKGEKPFAAEAQAIIAKARSLGFAPKQYAKPPKS